jgi:integrase
MQIKLTPAFVAKAAAVDMDGKPVERAIYWDTDTKRFGLLVTSNGHRSFVVQYRVGRRSHRMKIDGALSLDKAKKRAAQLLGQVANGKNPAAERKASAAAGANTFRSIAEEYLRREGKQLRSVDHVHSTLDRLVYPKLGTHQIDEIRRTDIVRLLDKIHDERGPVMADRTLATVRRIMNWHAGRSDRFLSPIVRGMARTKPQERARERTLADNELRAVWRAAETAHNPFGYLVRFILLTATRRSEAAAMRRSELSGCDWLIPGARYKTKGDFLIPLSAAAQALLANIPSIGRGDVVFTMDGRKSIAGFSRWKQRFDKACGVNGWTLHDLRRTARSLMSRAGVPSDHAERALGHVLSGIRKTYDRHEYYAEKQRAFEALAAQIERIVNPVENVVPLRGAAAAMVE